MLRDDAGNSRDGGGGMLRGGGGGMLRGGGGGMLRDGEKRREGGGVDWPDTPRLYRNAGPDRQVR